MEQKKAEPTAKVTVVQAGDHEEVRVSIPKGYEMDRENSTFERIRLRRKCLTMEDVWKEVKGRSSIPDNEGRVYPSSAYSLMCMNQRLAKIAAYAALSDIAEYYNRGWRPDWEDATQNKWHIYYAHRERAFDVGNSVCYNGADISFRREEDAQSVTDNPNFSKILDVLFKS